MSIDDPADHCCTAEAPARRAQLPGQASLRTRVGTWAEFRERMIAGLTTQTVMPEGETEVSRPLQALTTRQTDDGTIALLDTWAAACDVLAFYDERILEEGFIGTAKERRSLVEIANSLGYIPSPGVAASVRLAFEIQDTPLTSGAVKLEPGIGVMSLPPEGALPQTFETVEAIEARASYNAIPARRTTPHVVQNGVSEVWLEGIGTRLEPGQRIVIAHPDRQWTPDVDSHRARVTAVEVDAEGQRTRVRFAPSFSGGWTTSQPLVIAFRQRSGIFGHNAPEFAVVGEDARVGALIAAGMSEAAAAARPLTWGWPSFWVGAQEEPNTGGVHLEREFDSIAPDSWVCLEDSNTWRLGQVTSVSVVGRSDWTLSGRVTSVLFDSPITMSNFQRRGTTVHLASEQFEVSGAPDESAVSGLTLDLDEAVEPMEVGRAVIVEGETTAGEHYVLETTVAQWSGGPTPRVTLRDAIATPLVRTSVRLLGNVALATHGQAVPNTVIGSGDATAVHQRFSLRRAPLTWISAATGAEAELELRIDGVLWERVDSLYYAGPDDRVYVIETSEGDDPPEVVLGDGIRGARASTGVDNVVASIRVGIGIEGEVGSDRLTILQSRPQGLFAVRNPSAARGAADPESLDDVRTHAPLHVLTLDRLVSLGDYEDYARAFPGIGKARASELWDGRRAFVYVTVAAASGEAFADTDPLLQTLRDAIDGAQDPTHIALVGGHVEVRFDVRARLAVDPAYERADVETRVREALASTYAFEHRGFGQPVAVSEVAAIIHRVPGVVAVDVDSVHRHGTPLAPGRAALRAALPRFTGTAVSKAELLLVRDGGIQLLEMKP